jgi:hypothetical protein
MRLEQFTWQPSLFSRMNPLVKTCDFCLRTAISPYTATGCKRSFLMRLVYDHVSTPNVPESDGTIMHVGWPEAEVHARGRHPAGNNAGPIKFHAPQVVRPPTATFTL